MEHMVASYAYTSHQRAHPEIALHAFLPKSDADTYHVELLNRQVLKRALLKLMADNNLDALAYPAVRRIAAPLGEDQEGSNAKLSSNTGLPAVCVPAGFLSDTWPIGVELLGPEWSGQTLLNLALTMEMHNPVRRPPPAMEL